MGWQTEVAVQLQAGNTIINPNGTFVYSSAPASGNLIFSAAPVAGTDQFGNKYVQGAAAYETIAGVTYAIQLGESSFAGTPVPGVFIHIISGATAAADDPNFSGIGASTGSTAIIYSGQSLAGSVGAGIQCSDSTFSGVTNGTINFVTSELDFEGTKFYDGSILTVPTQVNIGAGSYTASHMNLSPTMGIPPNRTQVDAGTATAAQICGFLSTMFAEMEGRGLFT